MNNDLIAYGSTWDMGYFPLNPTGRWKLVDNEYSKNTLYIEHKRFKFFTMWIHEDYIKFFNKKQETIFNCESKNG